MRVLVTGAAGLVGRAVAEHCSARGDQVLDYDHAKLDIADAAAVEAAMRAESPNVVINCAAWTDVDGCESNPEKAHRINALGPENLARASRKVDAILVTISTDYVFGGEKADFYTQRDTPQPLSVYGKCKLEGERGAQMANARTIVVRTGFIFGPGGKNFLSKVVALARGGQRLKAIKDCWGMPTYSRDLAARLRELAVLDLPGIYHIVNSGEGATFETFSVEALRLAGISSDILEVVTSDSLGRPAPRPRNCRLKCLVSEAIGLAPLPHWKTSLARFVGETH